MPLSIALISVNRCIYPYPVFPLGLSHIAAALERGGHQVLFLDVNHDDTIIESQLRSFLPDLIGLSLRNIDDVNILSQRTFSPDLQELARRVRTVCSAPIVLGGSAFSLFPQELMQLSGADFGIRGEGEGALIALATALEQKRSPNDIPGLVYRSSEGFTANPGVALAPTSIVPPNRNPTLSDFYRQKSAMLNIQSQRGCPHHCCYCTYPLIEGSKVRQRNPQEVIAEIRDAAAGGCRYFFFVDSVFNLDATYVQAICEELLRTDTVIHWMCFLRPQGVTTALLKLMYRAGLRHVEFGTDSFCDTVLHACGKGFTVEDILQANQAALSAGVRQAHFIILGGPGETEATIREGFSNSMQLKKAAIFPYIGMRVYPGTRLHAIAVSEGSIRTTEALFAPHFYIAPNLTLTAIQQLLSELGPTNKNWIITDPTPETLQLMERMRQAKVEGPLWEFLIR